MVGGLRCGEYFFRLDPHGFVDISFAVVSSAKDEIADAVSCGGQPDEVASFVDVEQYQKKNECEGCVEKSIGTWGGLWGGGEVSGLCDCDEKRKGGTFFYVVW